VKHFDTYLRERGKTVIGWDEILDGSAVPSTVVMSYRGHAPASRAFANDMKVILAPNRWCYYDYDQEEIKDIPANHHLFITLRKAYKYDYMQYINDDVADKVDDLLLGIQACVWGEYIPDVPKLHNQTYPRSATIAEVTWTADSSRDWDDFRVRLGKEFERLEAKGVETVVKGIYMPELEKLRQNPTEMRSTNISKVLTGDMIGTLAARINEKIDGADAVLMPAVVGLTGCSEVVRLRELVDRPLHFLATLPPSVPGIRMQLMLKRYFQKQGGIYMLGDSVASGRFEDGRLKEIQTVNHGETEFEADNFILASGSFFSKGLVASQNEVIEPVFGLDVDAAQDRGEWYDRNMFNAQPYMKFGVATDSDFRTRRNGMTVENLYAVGAVLSGFNPVKEGSGAGVSILTALHVAENIAKDI
jgi:hypothetical protein